jgi:hypothetical protein
MEIYIDESGTFARPRDARRAVSCVGALVLRSSEAPRLLERFRHLRDRWGLQEARARELSEKQFVEVVALCRRYDPLLEIRATDVNVQTPAEIAAYKLEQGALLEKHITPSHQPDLRTFLADRRRYLEGLTDQLFIQSILLVSLIDDVLREAVPYYAFRAPAELGRFRWRIDAKGVNETEPERLWQVLLLPMLQSQSVKYPYAYPVEGDYSHFKKFDLPETPEYVKEYARESGITFDDRDRERTNLTRVVRGDFRLCDSKDELGLQLVDVLVGAFRRAIMGTLKKEGWKDIGRLMASHPVMSVLKPTGAGRRDEEITDSNIRAVMEQIEVKRKALVPSRFGQQLARRSALKC